ncbi:MAG: DNA repair protein RadC [Acidobacteria bacterium]|nr:DNA repair protein RadC [Acidobacteriota bacterium]MCB9378039.1 DNA repair protein RadC [Holophagales bacterium]
MALAQLIREIPAEERPRERLLAHGARSLGDSELVAVLLRTGRPGASAIEVAREMLASVGGLGGLASQGAPALLRKGLGSAKAATLLAAAELGRRLARTDAVERTPLANPAAVASYLALRYGARDQEVMGALYLDGRNRLLAERELYRGTLNRAAVEPRQILKEGLLHGAAGCLLFHTHPSGDPSPSAEDLAFTRRMAEAGEVVGIRLVDHVVVGSVGRFVSLRERGAW